MRDMVWIISSATAVGMAIASVPPNISHAARHRTGLTLLPPAISEYLMESEIKFVMGGSGLTTDSSRAFVIAGCFDMMYAFRSKASPFDAPIAVAVSSTALRREKADLRCWLFADGWNPSVEAAKSRSSDVENFILLKLLLYPFDPS